MHTRTATHHHGRSEMLFQGVPKTKFNHHLFQCGAGKVRKLMCHYAFDMIQLID